MKIGVLCLCLAAAWPLPADAQSAQGANPNVTNFKYKLDSQLEKLGQREPQAFPSERAKAAQELAIMKSWARSFTEQFDKSLYDLYRRQASEALTKAASDPDPMVREEAALALKHIKDDSPFPKLSAGSQWVQVEQVARGGLDQPVFRTADSSDLLLEVTFRTSDPSVTFTELSKRAGAFCEVTYQGSPAPRRAEAGGGDFRDAAGKKICLFAIPQSARAVRFKLKGFPEADLRF